MAQRRRKPPASVPLAKAAERGQLEDVQRLLADPSAGLTEADAVAALRAAAQNHKLPQVLRILLEDPRVAAAVVDHHDGASLSFSGPQEAHAASAANLSELLALANLADPDELDLHDLHGFVKAKRAGRRELTAMLLSDQRFALMPIDIRPLAHAAGSSNLEIVDLLLKDPRVDPSPDGGLDEQDISHVPATCQAPGFCHECYLRGVPLHASNVSRSSLKRVLHYWAVVNRLLAEPSRLRYVLAREPAQRPYGFRIRGAPEGVVEALPGLAWTRRRHAVLARQAVLEADHHGAA